MTEIKTQCTIEKTIGYECDICSDRFRTLGARLINETDTEWFQADFCKVCYCKVKDCVVALGGRINDKWKND
jgi:hypothetical protein